jgi:fucose 4-O-acetylase-like acetyltransferase
MANGKILLAPDYAKAFGIVLVVFGHTLRGLISAGVMGNDPFWAAVDSMIYLFHMPLFFYLSGIFLQSSLQARGFHAFCKNTALILLIPLVVWSYLQFSLQYVAGSQANLRPDIMSVILAPFPPRQQFWFLATLFLIMVVTAWIANLGVLQRIVWPLIFCALFVHGLIWEDLPTMIEGSPSFYILIASILYWPYFLLGTALSAGRLRNIKFNSILCIVVFAASLTVYQLVDSYTGFLHAAMSVLCVLCVYKIARNLEDRVDPDNKFLRLVAFVGMNSMIIYLAHVIFAAGMRAFLLYFGLRDVALHLTAGFLAGMIVPLFLVPIGSYLTGRGWHWVRYMLPVRVARR